jgi:hypothetical protein
VYKRNKRQCKSNCANEVDGTYTEDYSATEKQALDRNPQGQHERGKSRRSWTRTINKEAEIV